MVRQQAIDGQQYCQPLILGHGFNLFERDTVLRVKGARLHPPQRTEVSATAQGLANVLPKGADVGAFAAMHAQSQKWGIAQQFALQQFQPMDGHVTRCTLNGQTISGVFIKWLAIFFKALYMGGT